VSVAGSLCLNAKWLSSQVAQLRFVAPAASISPDMVELAPGICWFAEPDQR